MPASGDSASVPLDAFSGRTALVTGASRGIGRAIALALAECGLDVAGLARDERALREVAAAAGALPGGVRPHPCDLTDGTQLAAVLADLHGVAVIVNCAGWATPRTPVHRVAAADWQRTLDVCLHAPMQVVRSLLPAMLATSAPCAVVQILSPAARRGSAGEAAYAAAKSGLRGFTESLREDLKGSAVRVVAVYPGYVDTDFIPPNRKIDRSLFLRPRDVARAVVQALDAPPGCCVEEIVLAPAQHPASI